MPLGGHLLEDSLGNWVRGAINCKPRTGELFGKIIISHAIQEIVPIGKIVTGLINNDFG